MIEPKHDIYGKEADTSHLADYVELLARAERPISMPVLADFLADSKWKVRQRELYTSGESADGEPDEDKVDGGAAESPSQELAARVFDLIRTRAEILGGRYPFETSELEIQLRQELDDTHHFYFALLAITLAHHYGIRSDLDPESLFEDVVAAVLEGRGVPTSNVGRVARETGDFKKTVMEVSKQVGLDGSPDAASHRTHANEAGVDTLSHFPWGDTRPGHWVFIGQATCGKSGTWQRKILEPLGAQWGPLLSCHVEPNGYLAVPHHVEDGHLYDLTSNTKRMVLDRLRLCNHSAGLEANVTELADAVFAEPVFHPTFD